MAAECPEENYREQSGLPQKPLDSQQKQIWSLAHIARRVVLKKYATSFAAVVLILQGQCLGLAAEPQTPSFSSINKYIQAAEAMRRRGDFDGAYGEWEKIYEIMKTDVGEKSPDVTYSLFVLGSIRSSQGRYREAERLIKSVISIREKAYGFNNEEVAQAKNALALIYVDLNEPSKAEEPARQALQARLNIHGSQHPLTADSEETLGGLYISEGRYEESVNYFLTALEAREKCSAKQCPNRALTLNNLGLAYLETGRYKEAEKYLSRSVMLSKLDKTLSNPALSNLASLYDKLGKHDQARKLHEEALGLSRVKLGLTNPGTAITMVNLASNLVDLGKYRIALDKYKHAKAILKTSGAYTGPIAGKNEFSIAALEMLLGDGKNASMHLQSSLREENKWLLSEAKFLPRGTRRALQKTESHSLDLVLTGLPNNAMLKSIALESVLNRKGILQEIEKRQTDLLNSEDKLRDELDRRQALTRKYSSESISATSRRIILKEIEELEASMYRQLPGLEIMSVTIGEVIQVLPKDAVLVEFQLFRPYDIRKPVKQRSGAPQYIALVLKPNGTITAVPLGPAAEIEDAVHKGLAASLEGYTDADTVWKKLTSKVLLPLLPQLKGSREWFITPDGELNRVPFAALPSPQQPSLPLANVIQLRLLTTGRELLRLQQSASASSRAMVMANPSYDRQPDLPLPVTSPSTKFKETHSRSRDWNNAPWKPLPGTENEGRQIASILNGDLLSGQAATTSALQHLEAPRVLHIATHGFFVSDQQNRLKDVLKGNTEDSQLSSGLVFAGANQPDEDSNDDGLLTAAEAVDLKLKGTELVVLSACSTGQGEVRTGEGVYGLQRALRVAGARSTLLSLWKVDDAATAEFMTRFYTRLKAGEGRADALAATQKEFRDGQVRDPQTKLAWNSPFYWAAWQLVGDWRPIKGL